MDPFAVVLASSREDAVLFQDASGTTLFANLQWIDLVGPADDHSAHLALSRRLYEDEMLRAQAKFAECDAVGGAIRFQSRLSTGHDAGAWVTVARMPVREDEGELAGWLTSVQRMATHLNPVDAAGIERNAADKAERLLHIGAMDWNLALRTMWWSDGAYEILGVNAEGFEPSFEALVDIVHPQDRDQFLSQVDVALDTGQHLDVRQRVIRPDKSVVLVRIQGDVCRSDAGLPIRVLSTLQDITEEVAEDRLRERSSRALATLLSGNAALVHATDETSLLNQLCMSAAEAGSYSLAWYGRVLRDGSFRVQPLSVAGPAAAALEGLTLTWDDEPTGRGAAGRAARTGRTVVVPNVAQQEGYEHWADRARKFNLNTVVALPVRVNEELDGVLVVYAEEHEAFDLGSVDILEELGVELGFALERLASAQKTNDALESTIRVLAATVELRDRYTAGHQVRVAQLSVAIGREMQLDEFDLQGLNLAGLIHDVGKVSVPIELLTRPGKLRAIEFELIKCHAQDGADLLAKISFPWPIATIVAQHHERMDGSGYPRGLPGEFIVPAARILAVADVLEAMSRFRPYREALGLGAALEELALNRGILYDEHVVDACLAVLAAGFEFEELV